MYEQSVLAPAPLIFTYWELVNPGSIFKFKIEQTCKRGKNLERTSKTITLANKILILGIAARKFPAMDVIYSDGRKSKLPIVFDASGIDASKLAVPEASLVCLSFRANSQVSFIDSWFLCLNPVKRLLLRFMRKSSYGAKDALQRHIVYSFGDHYYFRKELKILNLLTGLTNLVEQDGWALVWQSKISATKQNLRFSILGERVEKYFWLAWSSLVLTLKACWLNRMNKFTVLRDLNFVAEKIRINGLVLSFSKVLLWISAEFATTPNASKGKYDLLSSSSSTLTSPESVKNQMPKLRSPSLSPLSDSRNPDSIISFKQPLDFNKQCQKTENPSYQQGFGRVMRKFEDWSRGIDRALRWETQIRELNWLVKIMVGKHKITGKCIDWPVQELESYCWPPNQSLEPYQSGSDDGSNSVQHSVPNLERYCTLDSSSSMQNSSSTASFSPDGSLVSQQNYTYPLDLHHSPENTCATPIQSNTRKYFLHSVPNLERYCTLDSSSSMQNSSSTASFSPDGSLVSQQNYTYPLDLHHSPENTCATPLNN
ncbi:hypothetical protein GOBAR_AA13475 [Gossypium barbadense]|uniref:Uncharacterized protein n=2 Tax=Gossypium barbadense TaxID=3634 RepID=A0A2P5XUZ9_GOSBA|nr:hypothetical protein GOBAR_AA13475 [Gossypium barbadense]